MSKEGKIARGKKWLMLSKLSDYAKKNIESDPHKMADVNFYLESIKEKENIDIDYSSKTKKELEATAERLGLDISEAKTKDDLIVILESNSDKTDKESEEA